LWPKSQEGVFILRTNQQKLTSGEKKLFAGCYYAFFVNGSLALMLGALMPFIRSTYGISYQMAGMLLSAHSIGNLISSFIAGALPVYLGRKKSVLLLASGGLPAFILMVLTGNSALLLLAFFLTGINRGAISNFNNAVVNEVATGKAWALNLLHSIFAVGAFAAPFLVLAFTNSNSENWIYVALLQAALIGIELLIFFFMKVPGNRPVKKEKKAADWSFLKNPYYLTAVGILFSYLCAEQAINGWLVTYLKDSGIMTGTFAQIMTSVLWVVILAGRLLSAYLSSFIKKSTLLLVSGIGYLACFILLILSRSLTPAAIGIIGVGFTMAGMYPTTVASVGTIIKAYPMALSVLLTVAGAGAILMPSVIGMIADRVGIIGGMSVVIVAVVITFLLISYNAWLRRGGEEV